MSSKYLCYCINFLIDLFIVIVRSNCNSLHVSSVQSTFGKRSIKFKGPMLWNNLPAALLREPMCIKKFRKLVLKIEYFPVYKPCCVIVLMFLWVHAKCSLLYSCVWMGEWWDGWYFTIFMFCFYWFFYINVIVLTMLAASIDSFLLFWQPATS